MLQQLLRQFARKRSFLREVTPSEVRDLIDQEKIEAAWQSIDRLVAATPRREVTAICLRGEVEFRRHHDAEAESHFREALKQEPGSPDAHYGLSLVMLARGEQEIALRHATFASNNSHDARMSAHLGLCHLQLHNYIRASEALRRATRLGPNDKSSWNNLGIARRALGDVDGARLAFARALELDSDFENAKANAALLDSELSPRGASAEGQSTAVTFEGAQETQSNVDLEQIDNAIDRQEQVCLDHSDDAASVIELARLYRIRGDAQSGVDAIWAFLARHPDDLDAVSAQGRHLVDLKHFKEALPLVDRALRARPNDVDLLLAMSAIYFAQSRLGESGQMVERACDLQPSFDNRGRLAASLSARCHYEEALLLIAELNKERPSSVRDTFGIKMDALIALGRHDDALPGLDALIAEQPNDPNYRFLRASINLLRENFEVGWADYAYRNLQSTRHLRMLPFPVWRGEPLEGKCIVIAAEQGLGDQVMFASCLPDVLAMKPRRVIVEAVDRVAPTLARSFPECEVIASKQDSSLTWLKALGDVDCFALLADLPGIFRQQRSSFPDHGSYLRADPVRVDHWRGELARIDGGTKPRIGVTWRGGTELTRTSLRSMLVTDLGPMQQAVDATWVSLQYGDVDADLKQAAERGLEFAYWPESIQDLDEFAALISALDLVVTVCNTTVHYAGALGREVWVMTPKIPEWRYGLTFERMPWYPTSRLFRQSSAGDWSGPIRSICAELHSLGVRR